MESETTTLVTWLAGGSISIWALISLWDRFFSKRAKELDAADGRLISILQTTVKTLETDKKALESVHTSREKEISKMEGENSTLRAVLQGRDMESIEFRKTMLQMSNDTKQSLQLSKGLYDMVQANSKATAVAAEATRRLAEVLVEHVDDLDAGARLKLKKAHQLLGAPELQDDKIIG